MIRQVFHINISKKRIFGLDLLRALAILFVVFGHGNYLLPQEIGQVVSWFLLDGVSIFFVLSGYLIGNILIGIIEDEGLDSKSLYRFWKRRWLRTLPNYFLILIILVILHLIFSETFQITDAGLYFLFLQNVASPHPWFFPEAWSLSIEEWFYLVIPIILYLLIYHVKVSTKRAILATALIIIAGATYFRYIQYNSLEVNSMVIWDQYFRKQVLTRIDSIMFGVLGAYIARYYSESWYSNKERCLIAGVLFLVLFKIAEEQFWFGMGMFTCVFSFSVVSISTLLLLPFLSNYHIPKGVVHKGITSISLISYSMYLINLTLVQNCMVGLLTEGLLPGINASVLIGFKYVLFWVLTIGISLLIYKYFELPIMNLRDRKSNS